MDALLNVTVESLATNVGIVGDDEGIADIVKNQRLKTQLGILQTKSQTEQTKIHHELAAKHLPELVEKYKQNTGVLNSSVTLLNVIAYTPYFIRFCRTPAGQGLTVLQTKRTAEAVADMSADHVGEIGQFLSTLLLLQGITDVDEEDKKALIPKLKQWDRTFSGRLASDVSERCLALLTDDPTMRPMIYSVRAMLESKVQQCGAPGCSRRQQSGGSDLMHCARCKTAVYCGVQHQKQAWPAHKAICFVPTF